MPKLTLNPYRLFERLNQFARWLVLPFLVIDRFAAQLLAAFVFLGGLSLLLSSAVPNAIWRRDIIRDILPLPFAEASHLSASLAGLALIVLARGLARKMDKARIAAMAFLLAGAVFALARGFDWEESVALVMTAFVLWIAKGRFYRKGDWREFRPSLGWAAVLLVAVLAATVLGVMAHGNQALREAPFWQFEWRGDTPRFLRASFVVLGISAGLALDRLINRPAKGRNVLDEMPPEAEHLLAECPDSLLQAAWLGDKKLMMSDDNRAALFYAASGHSLVCLGGPIGDPASADSLLWRFAEEAYRCGYRPVFYAIDPKQIPLFLDFGHAILKTGEVAKIDLLAFSLEGPQRKELRYARSRAERDGLRFAVIPKTEVPTHIDALAEVSDAWLAGRSGSEKGFSLGRFDPDYLCHFDVAVMWQNDRIVAFANLWRGAQDEMSIDLMRHLPGGSPILMDALMTEVILYAQSERYKWFNLGGAPLSGLKDHPLASTWNRIGTLIYRRGDDFYSFEGLRAFKQKFGPVWTPRYMTCPGGMSLFSALMDVTLLISRPMPRWAGRLRRGSSS